MPLAILLHMCISFMSPVNELRQSISLFQRKEGIKIPFFPVRMGSPRKHEKGNFIAVQKCSYQKNKKGTLFAVTSNLIKKREKGTFKNK